MHSHAASANHRIRNYPLLLAAGIAVLGGALIAFLHVKVGFDPSELFLALAAFVSVIVIWLKIPEKNPAPAR
jgi:hypothetical protein